ncbi:MAG: methionyl-tRNA formyltransferase [Bacteroidetes bacterium]|nr:methionyl-tRNA formyltransferase [Bacteroidota bacterium]
MPPAGLRIIFMGTPGFAVPSLELLQMSGYNIIAVVTAPDKPAGRGLKMRFSPVKECALRLGLPLLQPEKLSDSVFIAQLTGLQPDLGVVVAFRMLPESVWRLPAFGCINLHASILPQYRGAAPIHHAIINGETETGVTTFFIRKELDTGDILFRENVSIGESETAGELHDRLMVTGAELVEKTVHAIESKSYPVTEQKNISPGEATLQKAPKIFPDHCRIDWNQPVNKLYNFIRGLSPVPGAMTCFISPDGTEYPVKIYRCDKIQVSYKSNPGNVETDGKNLAIHCIDGALKIIQLQLAGRKTLGTKEFLRGFRMNSSWKIK